MKEPRSCLRCGKCCFVDLTAYAEQEDFDRWRAENRQDILNVINNHHLTWAGDRMISTQTGDYPLECHFLYPDTAVAYLPKLGGLCTLDRESLLKIEDRILYGSDFPNILFPREEEIRTLLALDLPQSFYDKVFWENGRSLLQSNDKKITSYIWREGVLCQP